MPAHVVCHACGAPLPEEARDCAHCGIAAARRRCGVCFDLNLAADRNCGRCGALLPEAPQARAGETLACPGCGAPMISRALSGLSFDECGRCGGLWMAPAVIDEFKDRTETRAQLRAVDSMPGRRAVAPTARPGSPAAIAYRRCPGCGRMMNRSNLAAGSGFVVDVCREHGLYFDHGELTRLFSFIEAGGLRKARQREAEAAREQVRAARRQAIRAGADEPLPLDPSVEWRPPSALELLARLARRWLAGS